MKSVCERLLHYPGDYGELLGYQKTKNAQLNPDGINFQDNQALVWMWA
jgi:hypothetical protein